MTQTFEERIAAVELAADAERLNAAIAHMNKMRDILAEHISRNLVPPQQVLSDLYDLMYKVANPADIQGEAATDRFPEYPTEYLPDVMLKQLDARGALHVGGVAAGMLGCASAATMASRLNVGGGSQTVPPTLWIPAVGYAGAGKSPAAALGFKPYRDREQQAVDKYINGLLAWKAMPKADRVGGERPYDDTRLMSDMTAEALVRRLSDSLEGIALVPDELAVLLCGFGAWKKGDGQNADKSKLLELWSAKPWMYTRVGSGEEMNTFYVKEPIVPIFGTIQPEFIRLLGDVGSGMQSRWLPHWVGDRVGTDLGYTCDEWSRVVNRLLVCLHSRREWTLDDSDPAMTDLHEAEVRWAQEKQSVVQTQASTNFLAKGGEHCLRTALVLAEVQAADHAVARGGGLVQTGVIPTWAVRAGIQLVDYCAAVWRAFGSTEQGLARSYAERAVMEKDDLLNAWLHGRTDKCATEYEIGRAKVAGCRSKDEVRALIERHKAIHGEDSVVAHRANGYKVYAR